MRGKSYVKGKSSISLKKGTVLPDVKGEIRLF